MKRAICKNQKCKQIEENFENFQGKFRENEKSKKYDGIIEGIRLRRYFLRFSRP